MNGITTCPSLITICLNKIINAYLDNPRFFNIRTWDFESEWKDITHYIHELLMFFTKEESLNLYITKETIINILAVSIIRKNLSIIIPSVNVINSLCIKGILPKFAFHQLFNTIKSKLDRIEIYIDNKAQEWNWGYSLTDLVLISENEAIYENAIEINLFAQFYLSTLIETIISLKAFHFLKWLIKNLDIKLIENKNSMQNTIVTENKKFIVLKNYTAKMNYSLRSKFFCNITQNDKEFMDFLITKLGLSIDIILSDELIFYKRYFMFEWYFEKSTQQNKLVNRIIELTEKNKINQQLLDWFIKNNEYKISIVIYDMDFSSNHLSHLFDWYMKFPDRISFQNITFKFVNKFFIYGLKRSKLDMLEWCTKQNFTIVITKLTAETLIRLSTKDLITWLKHHPELFLSEKIVFDQCAKTYLNKYKHFNDLSHINNQENEELFYLAIVTIFFEKKLTINEDNSDSDEEKCINCGDVCHDNLPVCKICARD